MKLKTRFEILIAVLLCTFALIGWYTNYTLNQIKNMNDFHNEVQNLYVTSLEMRELEKEYLQWDLINPVYFKTGESSNLKKLVEGIRSSEESVNQLRRSEFASKLKVYNNFKLLNSSFTKYYEAFHVLEKSKREFGFKDWGIIGNMRNAIHNVEDQLNQLNKSELSVHMLMLRRHEKDYLLRRDLRYQEKFMSELEAFQYSLDNSNISKYTKLEIEEKLNHYASTFNILINLDQKIGTSAERGYMYNLQAEADNIKTMVSTLNSIISAQSEKFIGKMVTILIIFIIVCTVIAVFISIYILRAITKILGGEPELVASIANSVANGKLNLNIGHSSEYKGMMKSVVMMTEKLTEILYEIHSNSAKTVSASQQFSSTAEQISQGAYSQATSIEEISCAIENITSNINNTSASSKQTEEIILDAESAMNQIKTMTSNSLEISQTISRKIQVINDIAFQTKILSLNASVEAARAGKEGSGFHVIADEVGKLADICKHASYDITKLTQENLNQSKIVSQHVTLILPQIEKTADLIEVINSSGIQQKAGSEQVSLSVDQLHKISQENAAASEEMAAATHELENHTKALKGIIDFFTLDKNKLQNAQSDFLNQSKNNTKKKKKKKKKIKARIIQLWKTPNNTRDQKVSV